MHFLLNLKGCKIFIKINTEFAPTCFGLRPSSWSLRWSLAKVIFMLKFSKKLLRYMLCGGVAACLGMACCHTTT
jgi:hypothetical protein